MIKYRATFLILIVCILRLQAQDTVPHLKGRIDISITKGTMECNFTLSNIPKINDYYLRLNAGMIIRYIKNPNGTRPLNYDRSSQDTLSTGETHAWFLGAYNDIGKFLSPFYPIKLCWHVPGHRRFGQCCGLEGEYCVQWQHYRTDGSQSAWYPVLYDIKKDLKYDKVTYDLEVNCADCKTIYINGSDPVEGTHANLKSTQPQELTMFAGSYRMTAINGTYFLNPDMDDGQLKDFEATVHSYKSYFEKYLLIPYKGKLHIYKQPPGVKV